MGKIIGWKGIGFYLGGFSRWTVMRWHERWPMPLKKVGGSIITTGAAMRKWEKKHAHLLVQQLST